MGAVLLRAICDLEQSRELEVIVVEPREQRAVELSSSYDCQVVPSCAQLPSKLEVVILAVKPQDSGPILAEIGTRAAGAPLVVSVMAGVKVELIETQLRGVARVVRVMPNTPARVGAGMSAYFCGGSVTREDRQFVADLFNSIGSTLEVSTETMIDAATAVSGTGPAYVFYVLEHLLNAAESLGFSSEESERLVHQTFVGALKLWESEGSSPAELRSQVTSPGGTTEAAIKILETERVGSTLEAAVQGANDRAAELGRCK